MNTSIFYWGHVQLVGADGAIKARRSLTQPSLSFGRDAASDIQIALEVCSRTHLTIHVEEDEPYRATAHVGSANGVLFNGDKFGKGAVLVLHEGDTLDICGRLWRWQPASWELIPLNTPAANRRLAAPAAPASPATPIRAAPSLAPASLLSSFLSPFKSPATSSQLPALPVEADADLISWDNNADRAADEDLIVWEQDEPDSDANAESGELDSDAEQVEHAPETPVRQVPITPSLAQRARLIRLPATAPRPFRAPTTPHSTARRRSVHLTIVPANAATAWLRDRHSRRQMEAAAEDALDVVHAQHQSPTGSPNASPTKTSPAQQLPTKTSPPRRVSTHSVASAGSSTSRRISALLLSGSNSASSSRRSSGAFSLKGDDQDDLDEDGSDESSDEEEEEVLIHLPFPGSPRRQTTTPAAPESPQSEAEFEPEADYESPVVFEAPELALPADDEDVIMADAEELSESEEHDDYDRSLAFAAAVPLPASPFTQQSANPPATPPPAATPPRLPRHSTSRRLSLREKVLIRSAHTSAHKQAAQEIQRLSPAAQADNDVAVDDEESDLDAEGEDDVEEPEPVPAPVEMPATPRSPSRPRDSIDVARSRSPKKGQPTPESVFCTAERVEFQSASRVTINLAGSPTPAGQPSVVEMPTTPSPAERQRTPGLKPRDSVALAKTHLAFAASVPLPETPTTTISYTFGTPITTPTGPSTPVSTPVASSSALQTPRPVVRPSASTNIFSDPSVINDALRSFQREMMSPINHHRVMATPKSALRRTAAQSGRRKSIRGFLSAPPPPASTKRRVAFNSELFVQPIYDIKGTGIDDCLNDPELRRAAATPLPVTPTPAAVEKAALFEAPTPLPFPSSVLKQASTSTPAERPSHSPFPSTESSTPTGSLRKAARVATATPPMIVQQALLNTPSHASTRKAGRVAFPSVETPAERIAATPIAGRSSHSNSTGDFLATPRTVWGAPPTPGMGRSQSTGNNRPSLAELLASPAPRIGQFAPMTGLRNNKNVELLARIERLRRKSMPGQDYRYQPHLPTIMSAALPPEDVGALQAQPEEEVLESPATVVEAPIEVVEAPIEVVEAPIEVVEGAVEPEHAPVEAVEPTTPSTPTRTCSPTPDLAPASPLQAKSPFVAHADGQESTLVASPVHSMALALPTEDLQLEDDSPPSDHLDPIDLGTHGVVDDGLPSDHLDSIDLGTHGVADLSAEPESPVRAAEGIPTAVVEKAQVELEELPVQADLVDEPAAAAAEPDQVKLAPTPAVVQPEPVQELIVEPAQPEEASEPTPAVAEVDKEEGVPAARGRGRPAKAKAAPKKSAIPTRGRKAAVKDVEIEDEPEAVEAESGPVVGGVKPPRAKATPKAAIPRGRAAKVVKAAEEDSAPAPAPRPTRRAAAKQDVVEDSEPATESTPASTSRSKRATAKVTEESATPARTLSRKRSKSVVIHQDEASPTPPVPALPTEADPTPKSAVGRGKRVLQPSSSSPEEDDQATKTPKARGRPAKAAPVIIEDSGVDENAAAEVKKPKAVRKAPALKKPGEPLPTRALRSRG